MKLQTSSRRGSRDSSERDASGQRPIYHGTALATDPHWNEHCLFYEYFHGDTGRGVGASHQTGWTGLIALHLDPRKL